MPVGKNSEKVTAVIHRNIMAKVRKLAEKEGWSISETIEKLVDKAINGPKALQ